MTGVLAGAVLMAPAGPVTPGPRSAMAANVDIILNGDPDDDVDLVLLGPGCPHNMAAGDSCTATVKVSNNTSDLAIDYTVTANVTAGADCDPDNAGDEFTVTFGNFVDTTFQPEGNDTQHMPARSLDTEEFDVTVTLNGAAGNPCQGASATVHVTVDATEDTTNPRNRLDVHIGSRACGRGSFDRTIIGTAASETLVGGVGNDKIIGNGGNDKIIGGPGHDCIITGNGNDTIDAGEGNDEIRAGNGTNNVSGGPGNDSVISGPGNDRIDGGQGYDFINAGDGNNRIGAGSQNDVVIAGSGNDVVDGAQGDDICNAGGGINQVVNCEE